MSATGDSGGRRRSRREERKDETRAELIAAAARVFAHHGFHGASLEQIAREAGYSTGAIYWHFAGKDDLFLAVYESYATTRVREFDEIHEHAHGDAGRRARAFADQWMARLRRDPEFLVLSLEFLVHAWRNPALREAFAHRIAAGRLALARILQDEARNGGLELPMPAEDLATVLRELGSGLGIATLADPDGIPDELFGDFVEVFFSLLTAPRRGRARREQPQRGARVGSSNDRGVVA
jgi:AcrR family transcriptional regulator